MFCFKSKWHCCRVSTAEAELGLELLEDHHEDYIIKLLRITFTLNDDEEQ